MKKLAVIPYAKKPGVAKIVPRLVAWAKQNNVDMAIPKSDASVLGLPEYGVEKENLFDDADLALTLGGDGTTLRAVNLMGERNIPIIGVNLGEMGFLMWVNPDQMEDVLDRVKDGRFQIEQRRMLVAKISYKDGHSIERLALNDVLVGRDEFGRLIKLDLLVNNTLFCRYAADGLVAATPTGSTAYSFSAGGPIIAPATDVFVAIPICSHSLNNRSLVFSSTDKITIKPIYKEPASKVGVSVDGIIVDRPQDVTSIEIGLAEHTCSFVSTGGPDFYEALSVKLKKWLSLR